MKFDDDWFASHGFREDNNFDDPPPRRAVGCLCGNDLPGRCPGPENCPLCDRLEDDEELPDGMTEAELCGGES